ncbi:TonB-dependent receptor plug domain-containing protein [Psychrobacter lutiphocae]|uniref:TonB-dependent receptor plug domain-containing protein n=1 Tax=Psychrobacter lutiphocae TaxID=540500 RepID=UPI000364F8BE|nr:Plug domain-containing protein [Psychrobacter lutiphocae]
MTQTTPLVHPLKSAIVHAMQRSTIIVLGACGSYAVANDNIAQRSDTMPSITLEPIVVTSTRSYKRLSEAPIAVQVVDKATLQQHHAHTLKDALALLPSVYLTPLHGKTGYEVRMQGFTGDQVLVLIDGLPVSSSTGSTFDISQYLNADVEQIEVIQGAASAQYGS